MKSLTFREDGTFTIVQFTDVHWQNGDEKDQQSKRLMETILDQEQPDIVVFTGDVIQCKQCSDQAQSFRDAVDSAVKRHIPWAAVFGKNGE